MLCGAVAGAAAAEGRSEPVCAAVPQPTDRAVRAAPQELLQVPLSCHDFALQALCLP
jgi:hypothetical protein